MSTAIISKFPLTFEWGRLYAWFESQPDRREAAAITVTFVAYDACPAFVIVRTKAGERRRCLREQLYFLSQPG